jgi:hypothetical protein
MPMAFFGRRHPSNEPRPHFPADVEAKLRKFWAAKKNHTAEVIKRDPLIKKDLTFEFLVPKQRIPPSFEAEGWRTIIPISQITVRDVDADLSQSEIQRIARRKFDSLCTMRAGPNVYDRTLMTVRMMAATTFEERSRLLNSQEHEWRHEIEIWGPQWGRYYFTLRALGEVKSAVRKFGSYTAVAVVVRRILRWLTGGHG